MNAAIDARARELLVAHDWKPQAALAAALAEKADRHTVAILRSTASVSRRGTAWRRSMGLA